MPTSLTRGTRGQFNSGPLIDFKVFHAHTALVNAHTHTHTAFPFESESKTPSNAGQQLRTSTGQNWPTKDTLCIIGRLVTLELFVLIVVETGCDSCFLLLHNSTQRDYIFCFLCVVFFRLTAGATFRHLYLAGSTSWYLADESIPINPHASLISIAGVASFQCRGQYKFYSRGFTSGTWIGYSGKVCTT